MDYTISRFTWSLLAYSEIDHTYLSIEAQCVSHHYPRWIAFEIIIVRTHKKTVIGGFMSTAVQRTTTFIYGLSFHMFFFLFPYIDAHENDIEKKSY